MVSGPMIASAGTLNARLRPGIALAQQHHRHRDHHEGVERARIGDVGELADRQEGRRDRDDHAGDRGHDIRRLPLRVDLGELLGKQAVARHDEEDAGLAEQQDQDDRRQRQDRGIAEHVADRAEADLAKDVRQRLVRADQGIGILRHRALARELFRTGRERECRSGP